MYRLLIADDEMIERKVLFKNIKPEPERAV